MPIYYRRHDFFTIGIIVPLFGMAFFVACAVLREGGNILSMLWFFHHWYHVPLFSVAIFVACAGIVGGWGEEINHRNRRYRY